MISSVAGMSIAEGTPATMTAGSTIPPPTAFTSAPDSHPAFTMATATAASAAVPAASAAVPNIPPPAAFTPNTIAPPVELPANITSSAASVPLQGTSGGFTPTPAETDVSAQGESPAQTSTAQVPIQAQYLSASPGPSFSPMSQPCPLVMGGAPTVPVMSSPSQVMGVPAANSPHVSVPASVSGNQAIPHLSQHYSSPVVPPPVPPPSFSGW